MPLQFDPLASFPKPMRPEYVTGSRTLPQLPLPKSVFRKSSRQNTPLPLSPSAGQGKSAKPPAAISPTGSRMVAGIFMEIIPGTDPVMVRAHGGFAWLRSEVLVLG